MRNVNNTPLLRLISGTDMINYVVYIEPFYTTLSKLGMYDIYVAT